MEQMSIADLVFVGFTSQIVALDRENGEVVWKWKAKKGIGFVAILVDGEVLYASISGYTYCLDARNGAELWFNPLKGFGTGIPCIATASGGTLGASALAQLAQMQRSQGAAASGA